MAKATGSNSNVFKTADGQKADRSWFTLGIAGKSSHDKTQMGWQLEEVRSEVLRYVLG
jgi:hypothetical protein